MFFAVLLSGAALPVHPLAVVAPIASAVAALFGTNVLSHCGRGHRRAHLYYQRAPHSSPQRSSSGHGAVGISVQVIYDGLKPYQQKRIETFLNPKCGSAGRGLQTVFNPRSLIRLRRISGKGIPPGSQTQLNFIPEQWNGFHFFCVPGEEFGFLGAGAVLLLFAVAAGAGVTLASICQEAGMPVLSGCGLDRHHRYTCLPQHRDGAGFCSE